MHARPSRQRLDRPSVLVWLTTNTSGVPRAQARRVVALGLILGVVLGLLAALLTHTSVTARAFGVGGVLGGATLAPRLLDWAVRWRDPLLGYFGLVRMLPHAGELSFLGVLGDGIGGGASGALAGLVSGAVAGA